MLSTQKGSRRSSPFSRSSSAGTKGRNLYNSLSQGKGEVQTRWQNAVGVRRRKRHQVYRGAQVMRDSAEDGSWRKRRDFVKRLEAGREGFWNRVNSMSKGEYMVSIEGMLCRLDWWRFRLERSSERWSWRVRLRLLLRGLECPCVRVNVLKNGNKLSLFQFYVLEFLHHQPKHTTSLRSQTLE